jgi:PhnB protein
MMKEVNIYLNFAGHTEEAFNFYRSIFGGEFMGGIMRFRDFPPMEGMEDMPPLKEEEKDLVGHVSLPLTEQATLMGTDITSNMPEKLIIGNNIHITLETDSAAEAESLFRKLSEGGRVVMPLREMFWAEKYGACVDKFGVHWQVNYTGGKATGS